MPVATNLIRVTRSEPISYFSVLVYYLDPAPESPNGKYHAYEFDANGEEIDHFEIELPDRVNGSPTIGWTELGLTQQVIYDSSPAIIIRDANTSMWIWRPRQGTLNGHIWYNLEPVVRRPIMVNGSIYAFREVGSTIELLQFDSAMQFQGIISSMPVDEGDFGTDAQPPIVTGQSYCVPRVGSVSSIDDFYKFPLNGSSPSLVTLAPRPFPTQSCSPYDTSRCLVPDLSELRFHRLVSDQNAVVEHLWPNEAPWLPLGGNIHSQYAQGYLLGYEGRVILAPDNAVNESEIVIAFNPTSKHGNFPIMAGIGNIP